MEEITKDYPKDQLKSLNRKIYQKGRLKTWTKQINEWANNPLDYEINKTLRDYFLQSSIEQNYEPTEELNNKKAAMPFYEPIFAELEEYVQILVKQHQSSDLLKKSFSITIVKVFKRNFLNTKRIILKNPLMIYYAY